MNDQPLTHLDKHGHAHMVDVGAKPDTRRTAVARGEVQLSTETLAQILSGGAPKGDVFAVARIAGILAAKRTSELIPLCHPLALTHVAVELQAKTGTLVEITARVETVGKTGAEMEALTAVSVAALTVYDMIKALQRDARIGNIRLIEKHGGKSGDIVLEVGD
ncbi:MAG TPA: cyclic pyranopterin monophosphate synthase MoaC [Anaerolineae bacterium]|nr:cyclic pyranopterin monophosphate synthase MoaC [Anaerolineae bacterium]